MHQYIGAHVDNIQPKVISSKSKPIGDYKMMKVRVKLPRNRPGNWWAMTVNLPCRPPLFTYRNAFCVTGEDTRKKGF